MRHVKAEETAVDSIATKRLFSKSLEVTGLATEAAGSRIYKIPRNRMFRRRFGLRGGGGGD